MAETTLRTACEPGETSSPSRLAISTAAKSAMHHFLTRTFLDMTWAASRSFFPESESGVKA